MSKIGLIPAAGLGTRLGINFPKELLAVGDKALIDYSIDNLVSADIRTICIVIKQGKEIIQSYLEHTYPQVKFRFCCQNEPFGNIIDAIKSAIPLVHGHEVHFAMADTKLSPMPYLFFGHKKIVLHCFKAKGEEWRNFGCISSNGASVVDKPNSKVGDLCWGAVSWPCAFTEYLNDQYDFTQAINSFGFIVKESIFTYKDFGITKKESMTPVNYVKKYNASHA